MNDFTDYEDFDAGELQVYVDFDPHEGGLLIALAYTRTGDNEWAGVCLLNNGEQKTLFRLKVDEQGEPVEFFGTEDLNPWEGWCFNYLNVQRDIDVPVPIAEDLAEALEILARRFIAEWFWEDDGRQDALVAQYEHLGFSVFPLNVQPALLQDMEFCEAEDDPDVTWFEHRDVEDAQVCVLLEEYI